MSKKQRVDTSTGEMFPGTEKLHNELYGDKVVVRRAFRTLWNSKEFPKRYERPTKPSETVPDMSMSVSQILDRHQKGYPIPAGRVPVWMHPDAEEDDLSSIDMRSLDLAERQEIRESLAKELADLEAKRKAAEKRAAERAIEAKAAKLAKQQEADQGPSAQRTSAPNPDQGKTAPQP